MPYARPTLTELRAQVASDVETAASVGNLLSKAILRILAWAQAGLANLHYGFLDRISKESTPWGSTEERLEAWAALKDVTRKAASAATGSVTFTGVDGKTISAGTELQSDTGYTYTTDADAIVSGSAVTVAVTASTAGADSNLASGATLTLSSAIDGINASGTASTAISGGADAEEDADLRTRMLQRYAAAPQGGALADYVEWAEAVSGVTRAWVAANGAGAGTTVVYTMWDTANEAYGGFPQGADGVAASEKRATAATGDQLTVANAIYPKRPTTALVYSCAPKASPVDVTINDLYPSDDATKALVETALAGVFCNHASVGGTDWPINNAGVANGRIFTSQITAALDAVDGLERYTLVSPSATVVAGTGYIPTLGAVTLSA